VTKKNLFDIIIIGSGLSGISLALELSKRTKKKVLILEKKKKNYYEKNFCFWNKPENFFTGKFDNAWKKISVIIDDRKKTLADNEIKYLRLKSISFFKIATNEIKKNKSFKILMGQNIKKIYKAGKKNSVHSNGKIFNSEIVFDSRHQFKKKNGLLYQHFYGCDISFNKNVFDTDEVTFMDIQKNNNFFHFFYVLPFSKRNALIETTYFSTNDFTTEKYLNDIKHYIKKKFNNLNYKIGFTEKGKIPMHYFPIENKISSVLKIGTSANWIRASTGYSFQNSFINSKKIVNDILKSKKPEISESKILKFMDIIFCDYIKNNPNHAQYFFKRFFKINLKTIVRFLTGKPSLLDLIKILIFLPKIKLIYSLTNIIKKVIRNEKIY